jgi:hypothetical protein
MAKQKEATPATTEKIAEGVQLYTPSNEEKSRLVAALTTTEFDVELGSEILQLSVGQSVTAAVVGMTKVTKFNDYEGEKTEDAIALLVIDPAAAGGCVMKACANEQVVTALREFAEKAQSGGGPTPAYIECTGSKQGKSGFTYKTFNIKTNSAAQRALQSA